MSRDTKIITLAKPTTKRGGGGKDKIGLIAAMRHLLFAASDPSSALTITTGMKGALATLSAREGSCGGAI